MGKGCFALARHFLNTVPKILNTVTQLKNEQERENSTQSAIKTTCPQMF